MTDHPTDPRRAVANWHRSAHDCISQLPPADLAGNPALIPETARLARLAFVDELAGAVGRLLDACPDREDPALNWAAGILGADLIGHALATAHEAPCASCISGHVQHFADVLLAGFIVGLAAERQRPRIDA